MEGFYKHLQDTLMTTKFLDPEKPKLLMTRLRRLYSRAAPDNAELNILRGILKSMNISLQNANSANNSTNNSTKTGEDK